MLLCHHFKCSILTYNNLPCFQLSLHFYLSFFYFYPSLLLLFLFSVVSFTVSTIALQVTIIILTMFSLTFKLVIPFSSDKCMTFLSSPLVTPIRFFRIALYNKLENNVTFYFTKLFCKANILYNISKYFFLLKADSTFC